MCPDVNKNKGVAGTALLTCLYTCLFVYKSVYSVVTYEDPMTASTGLPRKLVRHQKARASSGVTYETKVVLTFDIFAHKHNVNRVREGNDGALT